MVGFPNNVTDGHSGLKIYWHGLQPFARAFDILRVHVPDKSGLFIQEIFLPRLVLLWMFQGRRVYQ